MKSTVNKTKVKSLWFPSWCAGTRKHNRNFVRKKKFFNIFFSIFLKLFFHSFFLLLLPIKYWMFLNLLVFKNAYVFNNNQLIGGHTKEWNRWRIYIRKKCEICKKVDFELTYSPFLGFSTKIRQIFQPITVQLWNVD